MPTASAIIQFDTAFHCPFSMQNLVSYYGFYIPVQGYYRAYAALSVTVSAAGTYIQGNITQNTGTNNATHVNWSSDNWFSTRASGGLFWKSQCLMYLSVGDIVNLYAFQTQGYACGTTLQTCRMELDYLGTG
jgi:hypothetical protein